MLHSVQTLFWATPLFCTKNKLCIFTARKQIVTSSMKQHTIRIENLTIGYRGKNSVHVVAQGINACVNRGELTCLLGANGIGKSTLLRTLSAFQPSLGGSIYIQDKEINDYKDRELSTVISVVLTEKCDIRNMTVRELIGLGRSPYTNFWGTLDEADARMVEQSVALVRIEHLAHRMMHTLSDGEQQKVMIAKALAQDTPVIFLDEPTAFLDFPSKVEMMQLLHRLSRETGKTIFLSTHDLELALQIADTIWLMDKSEGVIIGTPEDLSLNGSLSRFFAYKGIVFDPETGLFRVDKTYDTQLRLIGNGQRYAMVRKALLRNGILAHRDVQSELCVDATLTEGFFIQNGQDEPVQVHTIEELLEALASHYPHQL